MTIESDHDRLLSMTGFFQLADTLHQKSRKSRDSDCVVWTGAKNKGGYGVLYYKQLLYYAHRIAFNLGWGCIPDGALVRHLCNNKLCVNPAHLRIGTDADNAQDRVRTGKHLYGEKHKSSKLTLAQVTQIRADTRTQREIAADLGITKATVSVIKSGKSWKHSYGQ